MVFDAWHWTARGNVYKRSEQYTNNRRLDYTRDLCREAGQTDCANKPHISGFMWSGTRASASGSIEMRASLMTSDVYGLYSYTEMLCKPDTLDCGHSVTDTVCMKSPNSKASDTGTVHLVDWPLTAPVQRPPQRQPQQQTQNRHEYCAAKAKRGAFWGCIVGAYGPAECLEYRLRLQQVCEAGY